MNKSEYTQPLVVIDTLQEDLFLWRGNGRVCLDAINLGRIDLSLNSAEFPRLGKDETEADLSTLVDPLRAMARLRQRNHSVGKLAAIVGKLLAKKCADLISEEARVICLHTEALSGIDRWEFLDALNADLPAAVLLGTDPLIPCILGEQHEIAGKKEFNYQHGVLSFQGAYSQEYSNDGVPLLTPESFSSRLDGCSADESYRLIEGAIRLLDLACGFSGELNFKLRPNLRILIDEEQDHCLQLAPFNLDHQGSARISGNGEMMLCDIGWGEGWSGGTFLGQLNVKRGANRISWWLERSGEVAVCSEDEQLRTLFPTPFRIARFRQQAMQRYVSTSYM